MPTPSTTATPTGGLTPCQVIENNINTKNTQFSIMQGRLEALLNDANSDLSEIQTARNELANINKDLFKLKDEQRSQGCPTSTTTENLLDNQTVISTSSVRRKDAKALDIVLMPASSSGATTRRTSTP
jgi:hypothetical protein